MTELAFTPQSVTEMAGEWPAAVEHLSASGLKLFSKCPEQYRRRYLKGEKIPPAATLIQGRADHTAIEHNFVKKMETGEDIPVADVQMIFAEQIDHEVSQAGGAGEVDHGKTVRGKVARRKATAAMKDNGVRLVTAYRTELCPVLEPLAVEEEFSVMVPGVPVPIIGFLDLVARQHEPFTPAGTPEPRLKIIDRKTSGRTMKTPEPEWRVQAGIYMLHRWLPHEWHLSVKTKEPRIVTPASEEGLVLKPSPLLKRQVTMQLRYLARQVAFCHVAYGPDQPWPGAILHQWACGYCGFRDGGTEPCAWWHQPSDLARRGTVRGGN